MCVVWCGGHLFHGIRMGFHVWVLVSRFGLDRLPGTVLPGTAFPLDRPSPGPPFPCTAQNFALFFSSPAAIRSFLPSLGVFSLNFGGVFEGWDPEMCTFGLSGCRVKPRAPPDRAAGARTRQPELQTCTFQGPGASNTTKIPREDPQRGKKERILRREREKKARNFGPPTLRAATLRAPWVGAPGLLKKKIQTIKKQKTIFLKNPNN